MVSEIEAQTLARSRPATCARRERSDSISIEESAKGKIRFAPFVGIAPERYSEFFEMTDRKDEPGTIRKWEAMKSTAVPRTASDPASYVLLENTTVKELGTALAGANVEFVSSSGVERRVR